MSAGVRDVAWRARLALAGAGLYVVLGLAAAGALVALAFAVGRSRFAELVLLVLAGGLLANVLVRMPVWTRAGFRLDERLAPEFAATVRRLARELRTRPPTAVLLAEGTGASIEPVGGVLGVVGGTRVLVLGLASVATLSRSELEALLARALAPWGGDRTGATARVARLRRWVSHTLARLRNVRSPGLYAPFRGFARLFLRLTAPVEAAEELAADAAAARACGARWLGAALRRDALTQQAHLHLAHKHAPRLARDGWAPLNVYEDLRELCRRRAATGDDAAVLEELGRAEWSNLAERLSRLEALGAGPLPRDVRPARELLVDPDALERQATADRFPVGPGDRRYATAASGAVEEERHRARAERAGQALGLAGPPGLADVVAALRSADAVARIAEAVEPDWMFEVPLARRPDALRALLPQLVVILVSAALIAERGFRWEATPGRARLLAPDGRDVSLSEWAHALPIGDGPAVELEPALSAWLGAGTAAPADAAG